MESQLFAIRFSVEHQSIKPTKSLIVSVAEQFSGFAQSIVYNTKNWFYPSFGGHHEFQSLSCTQGRCRAEFFVFLSDLALKKSDWFFRLEFYDTGEFHSKLFEANLSLPNRFQRSEDLIFRDTKVSVSSQSLTAAIDPKRLERFLARGYSVHLMWQLKDRKDQQQYREVSMHLDGLADLAKLRSGIWSTQLPTKSLSYVGFLVFVSKDDQAYESKVEVRNSRDSFYNCQ